MTLFISNSSDDAIYSQIENQIKNQILTGELVSGTPLPSMRVLAKNLRVSVITVQKAYENLSREEYSLIYKAFGYVCRYNIIFCKIFLVTLFFFI